MALDDHALAGRHDRAARCACHPRQSGALEAGAAHDAAHAVLGSDADLARASHPVLAVSPHRQHAYRPRLLRSAGQLPLRAVPFVARQCHPAEHTAAACVGARLHRHSFLVAALHALSRSTAGAAVPRHFGSACGARGLHGLGALRCSAEREPGDACTRQAVDQLARRGWQCRTCIIPIGGPARVCRCPCVCRSLLTVGLCGAQPHAENGHSLHGWPDRTGAAWADAARNQPDEPHSARFGLRRSCTLLDMPRPHR